MAFEHIGDRAFDSSNSFLNLFLTVSKTLFKVNSYIMTYQKSLNIYNRFCSVSLLYGETKYTRHALYNTTNKKFEAKHFD